MATYSASVLKEPEERAVLYDKIWSGLLSLLLFLNYHCLLGNLGNVEGMFFSIIPQRFLAIYSRVSGVRGIWGMFSEFLWRFFCK